MRRIKAAWGVLALAALFAGTAATRTGASNVRVGEARGPRASLGLQSVTTGPSRVPPSAADWKRFFPAGRTLSPVPGIAPPQEAFEVRDALRKPLGWVFRTDRLPPEVRGYQDQVGVLVALTPNGVILGVEVVAHRETPKYFQRLTNAFFAQFAGRSADKPFDDVQAVTGATRSSGAIIRDVFLSARELLKSAATKTDPAQ